MSEHSYYDDSQGRDPEQGPFPPVGVPDVDPDWHQRAGTPVGSRLTAVFFAVLGVAGFVLTWRTFVLTRPGQQLDAAALLGAKYGQGQLWRVAEPVLDVVSVSFVAAGLIAAMVIALVRLRWGLAVQVAVMVGGANVTTQFLKHNVLHRPDLGVRGRYEGMNTLPSGHTTVAASVSMALLMVVPRRLRPVVAVLGVGYTGATGVSTLVGQWHRPSDVIAAVLVVFVWTALVCALTPRSGLDRGLRSGQPSASAAVPTAVGLTILIVVSLACGLVGTMVLKGGDLPLLSDQVVASASVRAYLGMAAMVLAVTALAGAGALLVRQVTARG